MRVALPQQRAEGEVRRHWRRLLVQQLALGRRLVLVQVLELVYQKQSLQLRVLVLVPELLQEEQEEEEVLG